MSTNEFNAPYVTTSAAAASSLVLRAKPGGVMDFYANTTTATVWLMLVDVAAAPSNGNISANPLMFQAQVPAGSTFTLGFDPPIAATVGAVLLASTTQYPTLTLSATCQLGGRVR